jgi:hypothetical protein
MKILHLYYYEGAGGKYVANLLAHSHQVAFANSKLAHEILNDPPHIVPACLATIPSKENGRQWGQYENGCDTLFGPNIWQIKTRDLSSVYPAHGPWIDNTALAHQWLPLVAHRADVFVRQQKFFGQHQIFTVFVNTVPEFIDCAIRLKWPEQHHCLNLDDYGQFIEHTKQIKFDHELQWDPRDPNQYNKISELAHKLDFEFDVSIAQSYQERYIDFHVPS